MAEVGASDAVEMIRDLRCHENEINEVADCVMSLVNTLRRTRWIFSHFHPIEIFLRFEAHLIEDVLETFVVDVAAMLQKNEPVFIKRFIRKIFPELYYGCALKNIKKNVLEFDSLFHGFIKHDLDYICTKYDPFVASRGQRQLRQTYPREIGEHFVGMDDELAKLVSLVLEKKTQVISIWGVAGLGKTTIASKIYKHPEVRSWHFGAFAWVYFGQGCQINILLLNILRQLSPRQVNETTKEETLIDQLKEVLSRRSCLIVVDNVQDMDQWSQLSPALQMEGGRSVILLTTREENIAIVGFPYKLRLLNEDEAWDLLKKHAFPRKDAPG